MSHAHSDHLGLHDLAFATPATLKLAEARVGVNETIPLAYDVPFLLDDHTMLQVTPAGHVAGSAMLQVQRGEQSLLYTGDFKLRASLTVETARPPHADILLMESTYGLPHFRFPRWQVVAAQLCDLVGSALREGRQPIVMGYSLGKAQEIIRILTDAGFPVTAHGAVHRISRICDTLGVRLGSYRRYHPDDFHGDRALPLEERGVLVAPPQVARSAFVSKFANPLTVMMTGWALLKNAIYRHGVTHCLPLSDHADYDELLELIERVQPRKVFTHHGFPEFADDLQRRGIDARLARPNLQLRLFDE